MVVERISFSDDDSLYHGMTGSAHVVRYLSVRDLCKGKRVLDVACGEGYGSALLGEWGAAEVLGVDISADAIVAARALFERPGVSFIEGDVCALTNVLGDVPRFDLIVSFETMEHLADVSGFVGGIARYQAEGGVVVISCPNDHIEEAKNPFHRRLYTLEEFQEATTQVLGPALCWLLGTPAQGHILYAAHDELMENRTDQRMNLMLETKELGYASALPAQANLAPSAATCLFYVGVWGAELRQGAVVSPLSVPSFREAWKAIDYFKAELNASRQDQADLSAQLDDRERMVDRLQNLSCHIAEHQRDAQERMVDRLRSDMRSLDRQLAETRRRVIVYTRRLAPLDARLVEQERLIDTLRSDNERMAPIVADALDPLQWQIFRTSKMYRMAIWYYSLFRNPVLGPVLRRTRWLVGTVRRSARRRSGD